MNPKLVEGQIKDVVFFSHKTVFFNLEKTAMVLGFGYKTSTYLSAERKRIWRLLNIFTLLGKERIASLL